MNKKLISLTILAILAIGSLGSVYSYQEYLYRWVDRGSGEEHGGCAHDDNHDPLESVNATLTITLETTGTIEPYDEIEISFDILNFTEALADPYHRRFSHGIAGYVGDNSEFYMNNSHQYMNRGERVDSVWGSYVDDSDAEYILYAPKEAGSYTLVVTAMAAMNNSLRGDNITWGNWIIDEGGDDVKLAYDIVYIEGSIVIEVVAPAENGGGGGSTIPGFITAVMLSSVGVAILAVLLTVRRKRRILK